MSEEEKEAIAYLNKYIKSDLFYEQEHYNRIEIVLNYIDKLQKENEELKEQRKELNLENQALYESIKLEDSEYLAKKYQKLKEDNKKLCAEISDLKELLGE